MRNKIFFLAIFSIVGFVLLQIPVNTLAGSRVKFTLFDLFAPTSGALAGNSFGIISVFVIQVVNLFFHGFDSFDKGALIRLFPTLFAVWYFSKSDKKQLIIPVLAIVSYNLNPVGSGPYKILSFKKQSDGFIDSYILERNEDYSGDKPYLKKIKVIFYAGENEIISAFNNGEIDGFGLANSRNLEKIISPHEIFPFKTLKYYAVFFNYYSHPAFKEEDVRMALDLAVNKEELVKNIFSDYATIVSGPLVQNNDVAENLSSIDEASKILDDSGWLMNEEGIRQKTIGKEVIKMEFSLVVPQIQILIDTAELIKQEWGKIGVKANISILSLSEINNEIIKTRDYQMIIFGNILGKSPDLYSFWHSSEKFYPGLNLSLYENKTADKLIESIRENFNDDKRSVDLEKLQSLIASDYPAVFLYSPDYLYIGKKKFYRFDSLTPEEKFISFSSDRFNNIEKWYVETTRAFK